MYQMDELELFEREGLRWVKSERASRHPLARPLTQPEAVAMVSFFGEHVLSAVRVQHVPVVPNPDFYIALEAQGIPIPLDFSREMAALTLVDCILIAESRVGVRQLPLILLFHELVHVVQYKLLGVDEFMKRYVYGWAENGKQYGRIPIEMQAYSLEARFAGNPSVAFSVEDFVRANPPGIVGLS